MPTKAVAFHDEASVEYDAVFDWYLVRSSDAALAFDAEVDRALANIASAPVGLQAHIPLADICFGDFLTF